MIFASGSIEEIIGVVVALVVGITFHEFSHALVADTLGDHRPRAMGRVSLNPLAHLDPFGSIMMVLVGFGWGRPVPVNGAALRPGRRGMAFVAVAGPVANLVVAMVVAVIFRTLRIVGVDPPFLLLVLAYIVVFNIALGLFNLLPITPLDGWNLALGLLPMRWVFSIQRYQQYGVMLLLLLVVMAYLTPGGGPIGWIFAFASWFGGVLLGLPHLFL